MHRYTHQGIRATPLCLLHPPPPPLLLLRAVQVELAVEEGGVAVVYLLKVRALSVLAKLHTSEASLTGIRIMIMKA